MNKTESKCISNTSKNNNIKFSITIPAYKRAFLQECIESVLAQTYTYFELIIVDDASPEDLESVVKKFKDERISYFRNEKNCGAINVVDNWNICLGYATGNYIICMGDDDKLLPNCLEEYCMLINKFPTLHVYQAWTELIDENGVFYDIKPALPLWESELSIIWHNINGRGQYIGNILFDLEALKASGGFYKFPMGLASDQISTYIAAREYGIANSQIPLYQYRVNRYTITNNGSVEELMITINQLQQWYSKELRKTAKTEIDKIYREKIIKEMLNYYRKMRRAVIYNDLKNKSILRYIKWLVRRKKYNMSLMDFAIIFYSSIIKK